MAFKLGNEKQWKWRSIGFVGFSFLAHAGLITALIAQPQSTSNELGVASGNGGDTSMVEVGDPGASANQLAGETEETVAMATPQGSEQTGDVAVAPIVKTDVVTAEQVKPVVVEKTVALPEKKKSAPVKKSAVAATLPSKTNTTPEPESLSPEISEEANSQDQSFIPSKDESAVETVSAATTAAPVAEPESLQPEIADEEVKPTEEAKPVDQPALLVKEEATPQQDPPTEEAQPSAVEAAKEPTAAPVTEAAIAPTSTTSANESTDAPAGSPTQSEKTGDDLMDQTTGPGKDTSGEGATDAGKGLGAVGTSTGGRTGLYGIPQGTKIKDAGLRVPLAGNKNPVYPETERLSRTEGTAILVGQVKTDGKISQVFVERSSGSKSLDQAAMKAFAKWKYQPGSEEYLRQPFAFKLSGEPEIFRQRVGQNQQ